MKLKTLIRLAVQSILKNRTRAMLTMLGIIIGVAAVIVMVAVGSGARSRIHEQINNLGTHGRWAFAEPTEVYTIESEFEAKVEQAFDQMIAGIAGSGE